MGTSATAALSPDTILLVDNDRAASKVLRDALEDDGYRVTTVDTGAKACSSIERIQPDLILLDLVLADTDGLVLLIALRKLTDVPVVICSERHKQADRVLGLKFGADDFVARPFDLDELKARLEAVLRRSRPPQPPGTLEDKVRVGALTIDNHRAAVCIGDNSVDQLTPTEYRVLLALAQRPDEILSRATLAHLVWGYEDVGTQHLLDVHIGRMRLKFKHAAPSVDVIRTVRRKGYTVDSR